MDGVSVGNLVNAQPLRTTESQSNENEFDADFDYSFAGSCYCASGIVICYGNDTGEVLTQESFDDTGIHFIFSKATCIQYSPSHDDIGIGSVVQIYWSRSFERVVRGSHIIVQIEKMNVYKCCTFIKENVFITFNSQLSPGIAIGVTERNINVAFHPNCSPGMRYETLRAHYESRTEFQKINTDNNRGNTNRMVEVILASVPFKVDINGGIEKIHFVVIKKCREVPGYHGVAVVTKVIRNIFLEACFLETSDVVFFDSNACHWNILEKVSVGSLIGVLASPTFPSSCFKWYGYDVTMQNEDGSFKKIIGNNMISTKSRETELNSMSSAFKTITTIKAENRSEDTELLRSKKKAVQLPRQSIESQLKFRSSLLNGSLSLPPVYEKSVSFCEMPAFKSESHSNISQSLNSPRYSPSLLNVIIDVLEPHGLSKVNFGNSKTKVTREKEMDIETLRAKFSILIDSDGYSLNQKVLPQNAVPDQTWAPRERRFIGVFDDLQWALMGTFHSNSFENKTDHCPIKEENTGAWWYRRISPRSSPVDVVKQMNTRRNVLNDCTIINYH